jgi:outer membrane receptor protein involved in Fe transport
VGNRPIILFTFILLLSSGRFFSQQTDSAKVYHYDEVIVVADKFESPLYTSTSTVSKYSSQILKSLPINSSIELFKYVPGFNVTSSSGLYSSPIINSRGYNGGGEAEYLAVFMDNIQLNDVESGLVDWSLLSNSFINNSEIVKGGSSSLYGDFALGGVIDVQSFTEETDITKVSAAAGSFNTYKFDLHSSLSFTGGNVILFGNYFDTEGFRNNNSNRTYSLGANIIYSLNDVSTLRFNTVNNFVNEGLPGPIPQSTEFDFTSSLPYFKLDENDTDKLRFNAGYDYTINANNKLILDLNYINKNSSLTRTFTNNTPIIDPFDFQVIGIYDTTLYGDTKKSELNSNVINGKINYFFKLPELNTEAIAGVDYLNSSYDNATYDLFHGFGIDYEELEIAEEQKVVDGSGDRNKFASFINFKSKLFEKLFVNLGLRYDYLADDYAGVLPDTSLSITNEAFSPKFGLSYNYSNSESYRWNIYGNINRAFKAPTVEQLLDFDELNFGIFIPISETDYIFQNIKAQPFGNPLLKPQLSTNFELGTYQEIILSEQTYIQLSGAVYYSEIKDEIDFDIQTFKYENISESRHSGIELGITGGINNLNAFVNYTYTSAESLEEGKKGFQLKGIPKNVYSFGFSYLFGFGLNVSLAANSGNNIYLDDINENKLPDYIIWDGKLSYSYGAFGFNVSARNLFDTEYYTMGYTLNDTNYLYPMAQRNVLVELLLEF